MTTKISKIVFDIECDSLKPSKIHCIVAKEINGEVYKFPPNKLEEGVKFLQSAETLIGHNILSYDIPVIKKLTGVDLYEHTKVLDTLTLSRLLHPTRDGGHSLEKWGWKLNCPKSDSPSFKSYSKQMMDYCIQDVKLNKLILEKLRKDSAGFSKDSVDLEHESCRILSDQEFNGFLFDEKNATILLSSLNQRKKEVERIRLILHRSIE